MHIKKTILLSLFISVPLCYALISISKSQVPQWNIVLEKNWEEVFNRKDGWTGADVARSVDLRDGRTLWLFGDTWIGKVLDNRHAPGSQMVNNSLGLLPTPSPGSGKAPSPDLAKFYWGSNNSEGKPTAWILPDSTRVPAHRDDDAEGWAVYWLTGDGLLTHYKSGSDRLVLFAAHVGKAKSENPVWGFKSVGGAILIVENPHDPIKQWRIQQYDNPQVMETDRAKKDPNLYEISWGTAAHYDPNGFIYIYGVKETRPSKNILLARAPSSSVETFDTWQFRTKDGWSHRLKDAVSIASRAANEFSVNRVQHKGKELLIMVQSEEAFGRNIQIRTAKNWEGPWSEPVFIYEVPNIRPKEFAYAAKGHYHLSSRGRLLISYIVNSHDFWSMAANADIYHPRFISIDLQPLFSK